MHFYCINLERRPDRRALAKAQFEREGLDVEFVNAFDGRKHAPEDLMIEKGTWGNAMSHRRIWNDIVEKGYDMAVIFEDDVNLSPNFKSKMDGLIHEVSDIRWDLLYLGHYLAIDKGSVTPNVFYGRPLGIHAYVVSRAAAQKLRTFDPADMDMILDSVLTRLPIIRLAAKEPIAFQSEDGTMLGALIRQMFDGDIGIPKTDWEHHGIYWSTHILVFTLLLILVMLGLRLR